MGIDFCIISLYSIQAKLNIKKKKKEKTATAVLRFELVHVWFLRFLQQSADVSGRMGPHG